MLRRSLQTVIALLILVGVAGALRAEVSADRAGPRRVTTLLMDRTNRITDGADPIPHLRWDPYRRLPDTRMLNRSGAVRMDGRPDVGFHPHVYWPVVVWAYNNETDHDIAIAEWTDEGWGETRFLSHERSDEVDPRIFVDRDNGLHLVWGVEGPDPHVVYMRRAGFDLWRPAMRVTPPGETARRPTVATVGNLMVVAYEIERVVNGNLRRAITVRLLGNGSADGDTEVFTLNHAFPVPRAEALDPILHVRGGRLWMDWKHTDDHFGWSVYENQGWSPVHLEPWTDASWIGEENVRLTIQQRVLTPKIPDPWE